MPMKDHGKLSHENNITCCYSLMKRSLLLWLHSKTYLCQSGLKQIDKKYYKVKWFGIFIQYCNKIIGSLFGCIC